MGIPCRRKARDRTAEPRLNAWADGPHAGGYAWQADVMPRVAGPVLPWFEGAAAFDPVDEEAARRLARRLRGACVRRAAGAVVAQALTEAGYEGLTYPDMARRAGVSTADLERVFPAKADLVLAALSGPARRPTASSLTLPGSEIVARCLAFWERDDNVAVLREVLRASCHDRSLAAAVERHILGEIVRPFAEQRPTTDAYPRARLAFAQLLGLAVSRYVLRQEPLASADHETLAAWMGPVLDQHLRGELGRDAIGESA
jgi:AcrR family transcriptional regulator